MSIYLFSVFFDTNYCIYRLNIYKLHDKDHYDNKQYHQRGEDEQQQQGTHIVCVHIRNAKQQKDHHQHQDDERPTGVMTAAPAASTAQAAMAMTAPPVSKRWQQQAPPSTLPPIPTGFEMQKCLEPWYVLFFKLTNFPLY